MNIFMANPTVTVGLISFISAQIIKTALFAIKQKTFNPERITGAGALSGAYPLHKEVLLREGARKIPAFSGPGGGR